ncbi:MAG: hypothetical protein M3Q44_03535 [bacterium]|nr:hypothetical protein [bacterium]
MIRPYRFSPIENEERLEKVWEYLVKELDRLSNQVFKQTLTITTLKIFPHYFDEYDYLHSYISLQGTQASFNSDTSFYATVNKKISDHQLKYLGVRIVDPYRLHVGCGDYEIENFNEFKAKYLNSSPFIRSFRDDMLEVWHPDFDVLGYIVPKS